MFSNWQSSSGAGGEESMSTTSPPDNAGILQGETSKSVTL